jgi:single-strand DNA-binding protein
MSAGDTTLTITGNLTDDPELRFTSTGTAVAAFTVAASRRVYDQGSGQWQDGDTLFLRCSAWRDLADHAAESLTKGTRVIVTGRLKQRQ